MSLQTRLREQHYFLFEFLLVFRLMAVMTPGIAGGMLIQDKICLLRNHQSATFCQNIQQTMNTSAQQSAKDDVLAETVQFGNYRTLIETIPVIIWSLFLGPFLDNYPTGAYVILLLNVIGDIFSVVINLSLIYFYNTSPYLLLIPSFTIWFTGGLMSFTTTAGLYITVNTPEKSRGLKFVTLEIIIIVGFALATFIGGKLLENRTPDASHPQIRTYHYNYLLTIGFDLLCVILISALYFLNRKNQSNHAKCLTENDALLNNDDNNNYNTIQDNDDDDDEKILVRNTRTTSHVDPSPKSAFKSLFDLDNIRQTVHCFFKPRPNNVRLQILILSIIQFCQLTVTTGLGTLMVQFAQKVYNWGPTTYTTYSAISMVLSMGILALLSGVFIKILKLEDSTLILIAQISNFTADLIRGTFLSPMAFFVSLPVGALNGFGMVFVNTKFSKIIPKEDTGKVFSLNSTINSLVPLVASLVYTNIFTLSIGTYPGLIYHFSCLLMIVTIGLLAVEQIYCPVKSHQQQIEEEEEDDK